MPALRLTIRVRPGASRARVGGLRAGPGGQAVLGVWVHQRAVGGQANAAALAALAQALGVRRADLRLVSGERSRTKVVEVRDPPPGLEERIASWPA